MTTSRPLRPRCCCRIFGVLAATTAFATVRCVAHRLRKVNTLVLVHRQQSSNSGRTPFRVFGGSRRPAGRLGGGQKLTGTLDVAPAKPCAQGCRRSPGRRIRPPPVDECHHLSARSFELVACRAKARYVTGLSATVARKDGHHPIIFIMRSCPASRRCQETGGSAAFYAQGFCPADRLPFVRRGGRRSANGISAVLPKASRRTNFEIA